MPGKCTFNNIWPEDVRFRDWLGRASDVRLGCCIGNMYLGYIMYADDLVLLSPSVNVMQTMVNVCLSEATAVDMALNVDKYAIIRTGSAYRHVCAPVLMNGKVIKYVEKVIDTWVHTFVHLNVLS